MLKPLLRTALCLAAFYSCHVAAAADAEPQYIADSLMDRVYSTQGWGGLGINTAAQPPRGQEALKLHIGDKAYTRGLGSHADGTIRIYLGGRYETFEAEVGVQTQPMGGGSVIFSVLADGEEVYNSGLMLAGQPAKKVRVSVPGVRDLELVAGDGGDGIANDVADWIDARLTPAADSAQGKGLVPPEQDIAPTGLVFVCEPGNEACQPGKPNADGSYTIAASDGKATVGMQWTGGQKLYAVGLSLPDDSPLNADAFTLHAQDASWQWHAISKKPLGTGKFLLWMLSVQGPLKAVKWEIASNAPVVIEELHAYGPWSKWLTADLRIESAAPNESVPIEISNGTLTNAQGEEIGRCVWDTAAPLALTALYTVPKTIKDMRTLLRFDHPAGAFSVAVEDVVARGPVYVAHAGVLVTTADKPVTLKEYVAKMAGRETVLERVRKMPDQTLDAAMDKVHNPVQDQGPMMLSLACDDRKFIVMADGAISVSGTMTPRFGDGKAVFAGRHLDGDWLPMPVSEFKEPGGLVYRQRTCVAPVEDTAPAGMASWARAHAVCAIEWTIDNTGKNEAEVHLALDFPAPTDAENALQKVDGGVRISHGAIRVARVDAAEAAPLAMEVEGQKIVLTGRLPAGKSARCYAYLPAQPTTAKEDALLSGGGKLFERTAAYWKALMTPAMRIELPDVFLTNVIRASQVHCMLAARTGTNNTVAAWIASNAYGALDTESQAVIRGMDMMGQDEFARRALEYWLVQYFPSGQMAKNYSVAGTGQNLWTIAEYFRRSGDRKWLKHWAPTIVRGCQWIVRQRRESMRTDNFGNHVPEWGLTPPGTSADWGVAAYRLYNEALFYLGLSQAAAALAEIDQPGTAELLEDVRQYREDIQRAYRWSQARSPVLPLPDGRWVRAYPTMLTYFGLPEEFFPGGDSNRTWSYAVELGAHHLAVNGALDVKADDVTEMINHLDDVQFLREGYNDYPAELSQADFFNLGGFGKMQPNYGRFVELHALRDDVKPFIRSYFNGMASQISRENLSFWEHFKNGGVWNKTHETGWFLCQTRIMLVQEREKQLWLAPFMTNQWLKDGMVVSVKQAPTEFGPVGYQINSSVAKGSIEATIDPPTRAAPRAIVLRLRHPDGKPMRRVTVNGTPHSDFDTAQECITLKPSNRRIVVRAEY